MSYKIVQKNPSSRIFGVNIFYSEGNMRFMVNFWQLNIFRFNSENIFWTTSLGWEYFLTHF